MGGGYSDLNVYIKCKKPNYNVNGINVTITKKNFDGCSSFVVFSHTITFESPAVGRNYNVLLYDGHESDPGNRVFGYYYPSNENEVIKKVLVYYSVLDPNVPLVVSFESPGNTYNCYFSRLKEARWDYAYNISEYSLKTDLSKDLLDKEYKKRSRNRKIQFTTNSVSNDVMGDVQYIKGEKMFRFIFIPKGDKAVLGLNCLFDIDYNKKEPKRSTEKPNGKIQINPYYLSAVNGHFFDGIMVYFANENGNIRPKTDEYNGKAVLIEFYDSTKDKISFQRNDKNGAWWSQVKVDCNEDKKLLEKLKDIDNKVNLDQSVTVILDVKNNYLGAIVTSDGVNKACKKYTYTFTSPNKPVIIFERQQKQIGNFDTFKSNKVDVYYLKVKDVDDKEPFVIVFCNSQERAPNPKKAYHFADKYGFVGWDEFSYDFKRVDVGAGQDTERDLVKKLEEKLAKINDSGSCIDNFGLLRWYAYRILMDKEPSEEEIKKERDKERPKTIVPKTEKHLPIQWIIGGSVGGGVFVISSAALYGVYWYNTTIKLLT